MSDSINAINSAAFQKKGETAQDKIKPETKKKLEALGIDPSKIKTETEAQKKIKEVESVQANQSVQQGYQANPMQQVFTDAKKLAETIGIQVDKIDNLDKLFDKMDKTIKDFENQARNDVDDDRRNMVSIVRQEYEKIHAQYLSAQADSQKITTNLNSMATYNKIRS